MNFSEMSHRSSQGAESYAERGHAVPQSVKEEILPNYEEYLLLLQEKNRLVKKLKQKDKKQIVLEKKEKGFSLYVNGANANSKTRPKISPSLPTARQTKTAGDYPRKLGLTPNDLLLLQQEEAKERASKPRLKTAPVKNRRNWAVSSVEIQTARGVKDRLKAPEYLTGNYDDDFESEESGDDLTRSEVVRSMAVSIDGSSDDSPEIKSPSQTTGKKLEKRQQMNNKKKFKTKYLKRRAKRENNNNNSSLGYDSEEDDCKQLVMSITDIKKLRESLEMNASIQQSLAQEISSYSLPKICPVQQTLSDLSTKGSDDDDHSVIEELSEEEIEEELSPVRESVSQLQPGDTIVLELAIPRKVKKDLSVSRKDGVKSQEKLPSPVKSSKDVLRRKSQEKLPSPVKSSKDIQDMKGRGFKKVPRPVSGCKKARETTQDSQYEASAVLEALKAENQKVSYYTQERTTPRNSIDPASQTDPPPSARERRRMKTPQSPQPLSPDSAPLKSPSFPVVGSSEEHVSPVTSSESCHLTPHKLNKIMTHVQAMQPKQQKSLVRMLGKLDDSLGRSVNETLTTKSHQITKPPSSGDWKCVRVEVLSNWGDSNRVGLTEIQLLNPKKEVIPVLPENVSVSGCRDERGNITNLFNSRCKTNKERNMWSCGYSDNQCVRIDIQIPPENSQSVIISQIKMWNFNKSLNDLSIGVRLCRVSVDGSVLYEGELDKGCGNQVFDYSTSIAVTIDQPLNKDSPVDRNIEEICEEKPEVLLSKLSLSNNHNNIPYIPPLSKNTHRSISPSPNRENKRTFPSLKDSTHSSASSNSQEELPYRSKTRTLHHSNDQQLNHPVVKSQPSSPDSDSSQKDSQRCSKGRSSKSPRKSKRMAAKLQGHGSAEVNVSRSILDSFDSRPPRPPDSRTNGQARLSSENNLLKPKNTDDSLFTIQKAKPVSKSIENDSRSIPSWLKSEDLDLYFDNPPGSRSVSRVNPTESRSASRVSQKPDTPTSLVKQDLLDWDDELSSDWPKAGVDHLSTVFGDRKEEKRSKTPVKTSDEDLDQCTPMERIEKNRAKWRDTQQTKLEESWGSLNFFNRSHRGRLSIDITDDALDEYLSPNKKSSGKSSKPSSKPTEPVVDEEDFMIPELPYGRNLEVNIKTTWGDKHYVGLTGIEIFSNTGEPVQVSKIAADPPDINVLSDYGKDPRVVANLVDGVNRTRDDVHMWLAPFTSTGNHYVHITFQKPCRVALIRVWNYNKSRIHSYRGAKEVEMKLDGCVIFKGEIARACGGIEGGTEAFGDTILFTVDEEILEAVSKQDSAYEGNAFSDDDVEEDVPFERPSTADDGKDERPFTRATGLMKGNRAQDDAVRPQTSMVTVEGNVTVYKGQKLELNFTATWGDLHYLGLTGLEVIGKDGEALPVTLSKLEAVPRDVRSLPGHENDDRTLDKLIDGNNVTLSDEHMWLIPFGDGQNHKLTIDFGQKVLMAGLRIWNYNKSIEDTYRGAKIVHVKIDGRLISPPDGYLVRKGPGNCYFDYAQEISFSPDQKTPSQSSTTDVTDSLSPGSSVDSPSQEYEAVQMPCGFIYQFHLLSTCGDPYYVGLNGVEFYDSDLNLIPLSENNIAAYPDSVNVLDNVKNDVRTPDKLIDGYNETVDGRHMWLAPVLPTVVNRVFVIFDQPTTVSMIKIWNYSKTPNRGTKDFALLVDDLLVYNGVLKSVSEAATGILPTCSTQGYHTILFTDDKALLKKERHTVIRKADGEQDIQMLNDKKVVTHYTDPKKAQSTKPVNQALRPKTSVPAKSKRR